MNDIFKGLNFTTEEINALLASIPHKLDEGSIKDGKSAYEIAVENGYQGSEEQWLESLRGERGNPLEYSDLTPEQLDELKKPAREAGEEVKQDLENYKDETTQEVEKSISRVNDAVASANETISKANDTLATLNNAVSNANDAVVKANEASKEAVETAEKASEEAIENSKEQWKPFVDINGDLSWSRSRSTEAPATQNIKGPQGNSGITGSPEDLDVINDLNGGESTTGSVKVLAAEQGKVLNEKITKNKEEANSKFSELETENAGYTNALNLGLGNNLNTSKGYLNSIGEFISLDYYECTDFILLEENTEYDIIAIATSDAHIIIYNENREIDEAFNLEGRKKINSNDKVRYIRISNNINENPSGYKLYKSYDNSYIGDYKRTNYLNLNDKTKWYIGDCDSLTGEKNINYTGKRISFDFAYKLKDIDVNVFGKIPIFYIWYCYDNDMNYIGFSNNVTLDDVKQQYPNSGYYRLCLQYNEQPNLDWIENYIYISNAKIDTNFSIPEEVEKLLFLYGFKEKSEVSLNDKKYWYIGSVGTTTGEITLDNERLTTEMLIIADDEVSFNINIAEELYTNVYCYDDNKVYLGAHTSSTLSSKSWNIKDAKEKFGKTTYVRLGIILNREANLNDIGTNLTINENITILIPKGYDIRPQLRDYSFGNILYRKKWVACGDSFTAGGYNGSEGIPQKEYIYQDGIYKGENIVYPYIIGLRNNMYIYNEAVSGSTMAKSTSPTGSFSEERYKLIPPDADYITLYFGINDEHLSVPIGSIDDTENTTFYGAWNIVMEYLIEHHPFAHIGIIITNGANAEIMEAERNIAVKWGIPFLDFADSQTPLMHRMDGMRDGVCAKALELRNKAFSVNEINTHPNTMAHYYESTFIENFLRSI